MESIILASDRDIQVLHIRLNNAMIANTSWTPSKHIQAYSRILRLQQTRKFRTYLLRAKDTIDEYMQQLMDAKSEAIDEGHRLT